LFKDRIPARRTVDAKGASPQTGKPKAALCPCAP